MPTSSVVSQGDLAIAAHINYVRTDVLSTHTHDGTDGNATIEATSFTGTATYTGASLTFGDEDLLRWGTNADVVSMLRSTSLSADTELTGIIEGTSDHPGVAANSLIISNITDDGDIMFVVSDGGNSKGLLKLDGANGKVTIHGGDLEVAEALTVTGATTLNGNVTLGNAASDVITVNGTVAGANALIFEGATADGSEITLAAVDPTSDHTIYMPNQGGYLGVFAAASTTQISSTPAELNILDGATVVVGEINYLDLGSTAVGTAIASKAVILDSNKDYDGLRNLTITGELDAATLDLSGAADIAGDLVLSGGADGALQFTNAGENSIKIPDNQGSALIIEEADNAYMTFVTTDSSEAVTIAKTLTLSTVAAAGTDTDKFLVLDSSGNVDYRTGSQVASDIGAQTGATAADDIGTGDAAVNLVTTSGNITIDAQANDADVIIKVDDNGSAVTAVTFDGSDEGNAIFVNDIKLNSDSAVLSFGADGDTTLTHTDGSGLTLNSTNKLMFNDASQFIQGASATVLDIAATDEIELTATLIDVVGNFANSGTIASTGIITANAGVKIDNITIDGTEIDLSSGDLTIDVAGDIILDADGDDLVFAAAGTNLLKITNSSSDVVFQPQVDAKDIKFNQYDGNLLLDINDGGWVGVHNAAAGPGQLRFYEDTDNGTNYTAFQVGTQSGDVTYTLPTADGSSGQVLSSNGSGVLSWADSGGGDLSFGGDTFGENKVIGSNDNYDLAIETNGTTRMTVDNGGNIGIGISEPEALLHVMEGDASIAPGSGTVAFFESDGAECYIQLAGNSSVSGGLALGDSSNAADAQWILNSGQTDSRHGGTLNFRIASGGNITGLSGASFHSPSDERIKENIVDIEYGLAKILQLRPVKFNYRDWYDADLSKRSMLGLIAQEVEAHLPETVVTADPENDVPVKFRKKSEEEGEVILHEPIADMKQIEERQLIPVLIKAVQELNAKVDALS